MSSCTDHGLMGEQEAYAPISWPLVNPQVCVGLHRYVFWAHNGYLPPVVRHTCDNKRCINPEHLLGGTQKDNMQDRSIRHRFVSDKRMLTDEQVRSIRRAPRGSVRQLAAAFGIGESAASAVRHRKTYSNVR